MTTTKSSKTFTEIYRLGGPNDTVRQVADTFTSVYWDDPRKIKDFRGTGETLTAEFTLVGGYRTYRIEPSPVGERYSFTISVSGL